MIRALLKVCIIGLLLFAFVAPVRHFFKKSMANYHLSKQEKETIGNVDEYNPRVRDIQKVMMDLKYYSGPLDGKIGKQTRSAIMDFQETYKLPATGKVDQKTLFELNKSKPQEQKAERKKTMTASVGVKDFQQKVNLSSGQQPQQSAKDKIEVQDKIIGSRIESAERISEVQLALKKVGFYDGKIDGKIGPQTEKAIKEFQESKKLRSDGVVGSRTWEELKKASLNQ